LLDLSNLNYPFLKKMLSIKQYILKNVFALFFLGLIISVDAKTCVSLANGNWSAGATWSCSPSGSPACGDTIIISAGTTVTVNTQVDLTPGACGPTTIIVNGTLNFNTGQKIKMEAGSDFIVSTGGAINPGGGGGSSNLIEIGTTEIWRTTDGPVTGPWVNGDPVLPVKLISFELFNIGTSIEVKWSTASEINNDYFSVERSRDGENWITVGRIAGSGNSSFRKDYSLTDYSPLNGEQWYRLVQVDYDGNFEVFEPRLINFTSANKLSVYPNPARGNVSILLHDFIGKTIFLSDIRGKLLHSTTINGVSMVELDISEFSSGVYTIGVVGDGFVYTSRLVIE
jgi:hypothetical protein